MHNLNRFPSIEFAMTDAVNRLGAETVRGVLGLKKSALYAGCNANDAAHGFPRLTWEQVETIIRLLNEGDHPEFFSLVLLDLSGSKTPDTTGCPHTEMTGATAVFGEVASDIIAASHPESEMGPAWGPNEAAHARARLARLRAQIDALDHAIVTQVRQYPCAVREAAE